MKRPNSYFFFLNNFLVVITAFSMTDECINEKRKSLLLNAKQVKHLSILVPEEFIKSKFNKPLSSVFCENQTGGEVELIYTLNHWFYAYYPSTYKKRDKKKRARAHYCVRDYCSEKKAPLKIFERYSKNTIETEGYLEFFRNDTMITLSKIIEEINKHHSFILKRDLQFLLHNKSAIKISNIVALNSTNIEPLISFIGGLGEKWEEWKGELEQKEKSEILQIKNYSKGFFHLAMKNMIRLHTEKNFFPEELVQLIGMYLLQICKNEIISLKEKYLFYKNFEYASKSYHFGQGYDMDLLAMLNTSFSSNPTRLFPPARYIG